MRPASRNPESAQTRPHVKPPKLNKRTPKKKKKKIERKKEKVSKAATLKISRVIKRHPNNNNNKKVKKYG